MFNEVRDPMRQRARDSLPDADCVFRRHRSKERLVRRRKSPWCMTEDSVDLIGPPYGVAVNILQVAKLQLPTTQVRERLGAREPRFAQLQRRFSPGSLVTNPASLERMGD